ncbi:MAG: hypothetical protein OEW98_00125 [Betaproteobacteria bacterium]|nr:hypothetical protein [Betaproteobacteria bacterium]
MTTKDSDPPILTPEQVAAIRDSEDFHGYDYVLDSHEALRQRAAEDAATIAGLRAEVEILRQALHEVAAIHGVPDPLRAVEEPPR